MPEEIDKTDCIWANVPEGIWYILALLSTRGRMSTRDLMLFVGRMYGKSIAELAKATKLSRRRVSYELHCIYNGVMMFLDANPSFRDQFAHPLFKDGHAFAMDVPKPKLKAD
ncbi:MAG: hypothetical protein P4L33_02630 [Capsulimonadaceae bacterium]|nr:hypothetical protein [Capsulimonadaceae bacterium]